MASSHFQCSVPSAPSFAFYEAFLPPSCSPFEFWLLLHSPLSYRFEHEPLLKCSLHPVVYASFHFARPWQRLWPLPVATSLPPSYRTCHCQPTLLASPVKGSGFGRTRPCLIKRPAAALSSCVLRFDPDDSAELTLEKYCLTLVSSRKMGCSFALTPFSRKYAVMISLRGLLQHRRTGERTENHRLNRISNEDVQLSFV